MRDFWADVPPLNITALAIAATLGIDLSQKPERPEGSVEPDGGMSIAELSKIAAQPRPGGDTLEASLAILRAMNESKKGDPDGGE